MKGGGGEEEAYVLPRQRSPLGRIWLRGVLVQRLGLWNDSPWPSQGDPSPPGSLAR